MLPDDDVGAPVAVQVARRHAGRVVLGAVLLPAEGRRRTFVEAAVPVVQEEAVRPSHEEIGPPVAVEVGRGHAHPDDRRREPRIARHVGESEIAQVPQEHARATGPAVLRDEEIRAPVRVEVEDADRPRRRRRRDVAGGLEPPTSHVAEHFAGARAALAVAHLARHHEIRSPVAVEIGERGAARATEPPGKSASTRNPSGPPRSNRSGLGPSAPRSWYSDSGRSAKVPTNRSTHPSPSTSEAAAACASMPVNAGPSPRRSVSSANSIGPPVPNAAARYTTRSRPQGARGAQRSLGAASGYRRPREPADDEDEHRRVSAPASEAHGRVITARTTSPHGSSRSLPALSPTYRTRAFGSNATE